MIDTAGSGPAPGTRVLRLVLVACLVAWIASNVVLISIQPEPGAASLSDLAQDFETALNGGSAEDLEPLLDPATSGEGTARLLAEQAAGPHEGAGGLIG